MGLGQQVSNYWYIHFGGATCKELEIISAIKETKKICSVFLGPTTEKGLKNYNQKMEGRLSKLRRMIDGYEGRLTEKFENDYETIKEDDRDNLGYGCPMP